ncbi:MAG: DUF6129 family protein [Rhodocyclaceae bacterium]
MIDRDLLAEVAATIVPVTGTAPGLLDAALPALRARWPALRFVACSDDDIPPRLAPALEGGRFNLYLIGGGDHCLALTTDPDSAIGVVVATVEEDAS